MKSSSFRAVQEVQGKKEFKSLASSREEFTGRVQVSRQFKGRVQRVQGRAD
jgi:hypothetical protein